MDVHVFVGAILVLAFASACSGDGAPAASPAITTGSATSTATAAATTRASSVPTSLTAEEILRRSDDAMAATGYVVTEERAWAREPRSEQPGTVVYERHGLELRALASDAVAGATCEARSGRVNPFAVRASGATALYGTELGASAPEEIELLREETYEGERAWVIRFRYNLPSIEGPYPVEHTEWVALDDSRLLRQEIEQFDTFGFMGQLVVRFVVYRETPAECPGTVTSTRDELRPVTSPRLESPFGR